jgi:tetratricopeptide (TPR) repeat protein
MEFDEWRKEINNYESDDEWLVPIPEPDPLDDLEGKSLEERINLKIVELEATERLSMCRLADIVKSENSFNFEKAAVGKYALAIIAKTLQIYQDAFVEEEISPVINCILDNFNNSFSALKKRDIQNALGYCMSGLKLIMGKDAWAETVAKAEQTEILGVIDNITEHQSAVQDISCEELYGLDNLGMDLLYKIYAYMCADSDESYNYLKQQADALYAGRGWMFDINAGYEYFCGNKYHKAIECLKNAAELRKDEFEIEKFNFIEDCICICEKWCNRHSWTYAWRLYAIICWCIRQDTWNWKSSEQNSLYYAIAEHYCK